MIALKDFKPRLYQETILHTCVSHNTLVVLPTGMGKTALSLLLSIERLNSYPSSKVLFLAPTKPLVAQHMETFIKHLDIEEGKMAVLTGEIKPETRGEIWQNASIIFSTPQGLSNDIVNGRIRLEEVSCLVLDEIHRCVKDYDYVWICKQYSQKAKYPRILGLTASPGSNMEQILDVCKNANIEEIEVRVHDDPDVKPYIQEVDVDYVQIELPEELKVVKDFLKTCFRERARKLQEMGYLGGSVNISRKDLLNVQGDLHRRIAMGEKDFTIWKAISLNAEAIKVQHAVDLIETQGVSPLNNYLSKMFEEAEKTKTKATKNLVADLNFKSAFVKAKHLAGEGIEHPKLNIVRDIVREELNQKPDAKLIIFSQYRDSASRLVSFLNQVEGAKAKLFVGQMKKGETGLKQKDQIAMLDEFRGGEFNCLVSSSVGEEGLDIPSVDMVVFYEPVPSAIRKIQRVGRTGRMDKGKVKILVTTNTVDEAYRWTAHNKEKKMYAALHDLKKSLKIKGHKQPTLENYDQASEVKIFADTREQSSGVIKHITDMGVNVKTQRLLTADFILSGSVGVERKSILGDTPVVIKTSQGFSIATIEEAYNLFHKKGLKFKTRGIDLNSKKIGWFDVYDVTRHTSNDIYYISFCPRIKRKGKENIFNLGLTGGHNIYVFRKQRILCIPTSELKIGDYMLLVPPKTDEIESFADFPLRKFLRFVQADSIKKFRIGNGRFRLNSSKTWFSIPKFDEDFFFLVGLWVADGSIRPNYVLSISQKDDKRNRIIENVIRRAVGNYRKNSNEYYFGGKSYGKLFKSLLSLNHGSEKKNIPPVLFCSPDNIKAAFIRGYLFGDGWTNSAKRRNPQIKALSKSKLLIVGLSYLLYDLGIENRVKGIYKKYKNRRMKYYSLNVKAISLGDFIKTVGQIPTKEIKISKSKGTELPYYASLETKRRIKKLSKTELKEFFEETSKLREAYGALEDYLPLFREMIKQAKTKISISGRYKINYSTLRNITNTNLNATLNPLKIINILRKSKGLSPIIIRYGILRNYLKKLNIRTYLSIYPHRLHSEALIRNVYEKIEKVLGFDTLFVLNKLYSRELFLERVADIKRIRKREDVYDFSVKHAENFIAGEMPILVHNSVQDFVASIIDKRLLQQLKEMKANFEKPLIILEGEEDIYSVRKVHPNAIRGMLSTIAISYGIPILYTKNYIDTAELLVSIAKREQLDTGNEFAIRADKKPMTTREQQEYIISSLPNVGPSLAKALLQKFMTVKNIINAGIPELKEVENIGAKKAEEIKRVLDERYREESL